MKVRLYKTFSKRKNSTKQPGVSDSYTEVDVNLKEFYKLRGMNEKGERTNEQVNEIKDESRNLDIIEDTVDDDLPF